MTGTFRFGVVATPQGDGDSWRATARRIAELGYSTLLMPDGLQLLSPFPSLAVAASAADVRVATFVLASPLRTPMAAAWDAHSMTVLTDGRFELGIGTGIPAAKQSAERLGMPYGSAAERLAQVGETIDRVRELDGDGLRTPVLVAAGGPRSRALAAEKADIVTLAAGALANIDEMATMADDLRAKAGDRAATIELAMNIFVVGEEVPPWTKQFMGVDADELIAADALTMLRGNPQQMADELQRRRDRIGTSYISVNAQFLEQFAPVVELLAGK
ncbi:MAG: LLM class flavin-dependent oxidoreductase [Pseudonocardiaceae bacterium]|nr:MAG: LLM class flavin-dependent oxidoreductase [Pseudonocardiaceae bacterium]